MSAITRVEGSEENNSIRVVAALRPDSEFIADGYYVIDGQRDVAENTDMFWISGYGGDDHIIGGPTGDQIYGGEGVDRIFAGAGDDRLIIDFGDIGDVRGELLPGETYHGGAGHDTISLVFGGLFDFRQVALISVETIRMPSAMFAGAATLVFEASQLSGRGGIREIENPSFDTQILEIYMGSLVDFVLSPDVGEGFMRLGSFSESGVKIYGDAEAERLSGSRNTMDSLYGGGGHDSLFGNLGSDDLFGGNGNDHLRGEGAVGPWTGGRGDDDRLFGGRGNDRLWGDRGNDYLAGGNGSDVLNGGNGSDTLIGGIGRDAFVFNSALVPENVDTISDFSVLDDIIRLDSAMFMGLAEGILAGTAFIANSTGDAMDDAHRIVYDTETGRLFFDGDGSGANARVQFAVVSPQLLLTSADFLVF